MMLRAGGRRRALWWRVALAASGLVIAAAALETDIGAQEIAGLAQWWRPGEARRFEASTDYRNASGVLRVLLTDNGFAAGDHPFFAPLGRNGRACVTCHQPSDGMGLSVETIRRQWDLTGGRDPLFAAVDGSNCPNLPQQLRSSHSLLLDKGLFRIALPWPPRAEDGTPVTPEFTLEVASDPTGCNLDPVHGLRSPYPTVSVFRRPRPVGNMKYLLSLPHGVPPHEYFLYNDKTLLPRDPETGAFLSVQLMADGRHPTLRGQAQDAARAHLEAQASLTDTQIRQIEQFERALYVAQVRHDRAGDLTGPGNPPGLGPAAMRDGAPGELGNNPFNRVFGTFAIWLGGAEAAASAEDKRQADFRASVARGAALFYERRFIIKDVGVYNDKGLGNPFKRSCASGCHNTLLAGMDLAPGFMDLGLNNWPWSQRDDLPLFKVVCRADAVPQSYLGRVIYTHDPGRAMVTGKCRDIGATMTQQMRGLAARAPYFMNGSAATLRELVDFYDRRFNIGYSEREKQDLVHFMETL